MNYFTSDPHLGHEKAICFPERKGFTVESWGEMFCSLVNSRVTKHDRLFILGDFALGVGKSPFASWRMKLKPKDIWLIKGNHDPSDVVCKEVFGDRFRITYETKVKGISCWLSHYPHMAWPKSHYGAFHLYGHLHDQRSECYDTIWPQRRSLDICPESYKRIHGDWGIWSEDEVYDYLSIRTGHDDVTWYREKRGEF